MERNKMSKRMRNLLVTIATLQKNGCTCAFVDLAAAFDAQAAVELGVELQDLILVRLFNCGFNATAISTIVAFIERASVYFIVIYGSGTTIPEDDVNWREMSVGLRKIADACTKNGTTIMFSN